MKDLVKHNYPYCFSVAYCEGKRFLYQAYKVKEDQQFLLGLIRKKDRKNLDFMEEFYKTLIKEGQKDSQKDIHSRNGFQLLPISVTGHLDPSSDELMKEFEEIKIKRRKNK